MNLATYYFPRRGKGMIKPSLMSMPIALNAGFGKNSKLSNYKSNQKEQDKLTIRKFFPETWLWENLTCGYE